MYVRRVQIYPALGKAPELQSLLEGQVKREQTRGRAVGLLRQIVSAEGPTLLVIFYHNDLSELEKQLRENQADPAWGAFVAKMNSLIRQPNKQDLFEMLVPLQG